MAFNIGVLNNEVVKNIMNRRSYRAYKSAGIPGDVLEAIVNCGLNSPSARNRQAWHFTVIQDRELISELNRDAMAAFPEENRAKWGADYNMFYHAPVVVVYSGIRDDRYSLIDCSIAMQTMCLAAESFDVGSCMIGMVKALFDSEAGDKYVEKFNLSEGYWPQFACCFGYKGKEMKRPDRLPDRVHYIG
jgi:nitroreductase